MRARFSRLIMLLVIACLLPACAGAAVTPDRQSTQVSPAVQITQPLHPTLPAIEPTITAAPAATALPAAIPEARRIVLEWPPVIRTGDSDTIRLTLEMDSESRLTPTAEVSGHSVRGTPVEVPNLYDTHRVLAEARLDIAGLTVKPDILTSQPLLPGKAVTFYWSVSTDQVADYRGTVWLSLRFIPLGKNDTSVPDSSTVLSAQQIEIRSANLLGMTGFTARLVGGIGVVAGSAFGLDNVIGWVWGMVKKKWRKEKKGNGE